MTAEITIVVPHKLSFPRRLACALGLHRWRSRDPETCPFCGEARGEGWEFAGAVHDFGLSVSLFTWRRA